MAVKRLAQLVKTVEGEDRQVLDEPRDRVPASGQGPGLVLVLDPALAQVWVLLFVPLYVLKLRRRPAVRMLVA